MLRAQLKNMMPKNIQVSIEDKGCADYEAVYEHIYKMLPTFKDREQTSSRKDPDAMEVDALNTNEKSDGECEAGKEREDCMTKEGLKRQPSCATPNGETSDASHHTCRPSHFREMR